MDYFLDTETTGTGEQDAVLEISLIDEKGTSHLTTLVSPLAPIGASARATHGLTEEDLGDAPEFEDVAPRLSRLLGDDYVERVWAFNAEFDRKMLIQTAELAGLPSVKDAVQSASWRDLMKPTTQFLETEEWVSLAEAAAKMSISVPDGNLHRALSDAELARRLWIELKNEGALEDL